MVRSVSQSEISVSWKLALSFRCIPETVDVSERDFLEVLHIVRIGTELRVAHRLDRFSVEDLIIDEPLPTTAESNFNRDRHSQRSEAQKEQKDHLAEGLSCI